MHMMLGAKAFDPSDTELLRALHSRNSKNIRNPLIFLQKMASYSCFWRVPSSKILLQASLRRLLACNPWYHNINSFLCTQKYHCTMVLITIFSAAISVFLFTISSICALCASDSSAALITTSTASPLMLTTAS